MKYNCRECPEAVRARCIQESHASPSVKAMLNRAFAARTDTQQTWELLQINCLLRREDEEAARPPAESLLQRRLRAAAERRQAETAASQAEPIVIGDDQITEQISLEISPEIVTPHPTPEKAHRTAATRRALRYVLTVETTNHRIALSEEGEMVLGRFDPVTGIAPDIDLSFDDQDAMMVSRRHVRVSARNGRHFLEDLGSTNGTKVNGKLLRIGERVLLVSGDRIWLGNCLLTYDPAPDWVSESPDTTQHTFYLLSTFTGHRFFLPVSGEVIIGRGDLAIGFTPDIDLANEGHASTVVSRRHAKITLWKGQHYLEDLGSANGTRLNGTPVHLGESFPLHPGDHIWLGGCVLAYDVEVPGLR
ncbi:MAG: FHA domain-containing protein [Chloroflexota bacterium]|nr:FHA domain-containing protein [Chloroflexota bacterium]